MPMKRLLAFLLLAAPLSAQAAIDPKTAEFCMKAADFAGCVQTMSGKSSSGNTKSCDGIRKGLAIIKERMISGTSLTKLDVNTNPLSDALAIAKAGGDAKESCSKLLADSQSVLDMIRVLCTQWQVEIEDGQESTKQGRKVWPAPLVEPNIKTFNLLAGGTGIAITGPGEIRGMSDTSSQGFDYELREFRGGMLGCMGLCGNWVIRSVKGRMVQVIATKIESALSETEIDWSQR